MASTRVMTSEEHAGEEVTSIKKSRLVIDNTNYALAA